MSIDQYYLDKVDGWKSMPNWIDNKKSFKEFCAEYKMNYGLFSGYIPYIEKMKSNDERSRFIDKKITECEKALTDQKNLLALNYNKIESNY